MDSLLDKLPPQATDAEVVVLASMLKMPTMIPEISAIVSTQDFYRPEHQIIFDACAYLWRELGELNDYILVTELSSRGKLEEIGGFDFLIELTNCPGGESVIFHARIVKEKSILRKTIALAGRMLKDAYNPGQDSSELLELFSAGLSELTDNSAPQDGVVSLRQAMSDTIFALKDITEEKKPFVVPSAYESIRDTLNGGYYEGEVTVVGGDEGGGKSTFCYNEVEAAGASDMRTLVVSYEISKMFLGPIFGSLAADTDTRSLLPRPGVGNQWERLSPFVQERLVKMMNSPAATRIDLLFNYPDRTQIAAQLADASAKKDPYRLLVIDHLHLMPDDRDQGSRGIEEWVRYNINGVKRMAEKFHVAVLLPTQYVDKRDYKREPTINDLKGSSSIKQTASNVLLLWVPPTEGYDHPVDAVPLTGIWRKVRYGESSTGFTLSWNKKTRRMK